MFSAAERCETMAWEMESAVAGRLVDEGAEGAEIVCPNGVDG